MMSRNTTVSSSEYDRRMMQSVSGTPPLGMARRQRTWYSVTFVMSYRVTPPAIDAFVIVGSGSEAPNSVNVASCGVPSNTIADPLVSADAILVDPSGSSHGQYACSVSLDSAAIAV